MRNLLREHPHVSKERNLVGVIRGRSRLKHLGRLCPAFDSGQTFVAVW
jgi:hypothetical protein